MALVDYMERSDEVLLGPVADGTVYDWSEPPDDPDRLFVLWQAGLMIARLPDTGEFAFISVVEGAAAPEISFDPAGLFSTNPAVPNRIAFYKDGTTLKLKFSLSVPAFKLKRIM